jgi:hypothetical protein
MAPIIVVLLAAGAADAQPLVMAPRQRLPKSPEGEVVVLSVNLQEAFTPSDVQNSIEMRNFARRVRELVQARTILYAPDVLLLQEVASFSITKLARFLKDATGHTYAILIGPELSPIVKDTAEHQIVRDTAILINAATMEGIGKKGFITSRYGAPESRNAAKPRWKQQAFAAVQEKTGGFSLALASVHFTPTEEMASPSMEPPTPRFRISTDGATGSPRNASTSCSPARRSCLLPTTRRTGPPKGMPTTSRNIGSCGRSCSGAGRSG